MFKSGVACRYLDSSMLANVVVVPSQDSIFTLECPVARGSKETGGRYATYSGPVLNGMDSRSTITCNVKTIVSNLIVNSGFEYNHTKFCGGTTNTRCSSLIDESLIAPWRLSSGPSFEMDFTTTSFSFSGGWSLYLGEGVSVTQTVTNIISNKMYTIKLQVAQLPKDSDDLTCQAVKTGYVQILSNNDSPLASKKFTHDPQILGSPYTVMNITFSFKLQSTMTVKVKIGSLTKGNCGFLVDNVYLGL